jgi:hypothetical protein
MGTLAREIRVLQVIKKKKSDDVDDARRLLKEMKEREETAKQNSGNPYKEVIGKAEDVLKKFNISKPYYHGGKYNGKGMCTFMSKSSNIMADIRDMILGIPLEQRCDDQEVLEHTWRFQNCLKVFDYVFSKAREPSGFISPQEVEDLHPFVIEAMKLYRELGLSVSPKPHAIEDHLCEQISRLKGIGDLGEDFVEQSHQDGIRKESKSRNAGSREIAAIQHCRWEHKENLPTVLDKKKAVIRKSVRTKRVRDQDGNVGAAVPVSKNDEKKLRIAEEKLTIRTNALAETTRTNGVYLKSGRQLNIDSKRRTIERAEAVIQKNISALIRRQQNIG